MGSMRYNPFSIAIAAGIVLLVLPQALAIFLPITHPEALAWIFPLGLALVMVGIGARIYQSRRKGDRHLDPARRRRFLIGVAIVVGSLLGYILLHGVGPKIAYRPPELASDGSSLEPQGTREWFALRDPQLDSTPLRYDAANDTTLVLAGDGHGAIDYAIRLRGDHSNLGSEYRLIVAPETTPMATALSPLSPPMGTVNRSADAVFVVKSLAFHIGVHFLLPFAAAIGVALLCLAWPERAIGGASGSLGGSAFAWMRLNSGFGLVDVIFILPVFLILMIIALGLLINTDRDSRRRVVAFLILAFIVSAILFAAHLLDAFPIDPDA